MTKEKNLRKLSLVVDLILEQELAALSEITAKGSCIEVELDELDQALCDLEFHRGQQRISSLSKNDFAWQNWRREKKMDRNVKLAAIRAEREAQIALTRKAFGRAQAIGKLGSKFKS